MPTDCPLAWDVVPSPSSRDARGSQLNAIAASSSGDVWAVGKQQIGASTNLLTEHWNGTTWTIVPGPQFYNSTLLGVTTLSSNNAWAVGTYDAFYSGPPLVLHWDGGAWSQVPCPNPGREGVLHGITSIGTNDIWAVGDYLNWPDLGLLIEHWDGVQWNIALTDTTISSLKAVSAVSSSDVWAVGQTPQTGGGLHTLTMHWNGTAWSIVPSPDPGDYDHLYGVLALSANDVWAVGRTDTGAMTMHWDGSAWNIVPVPNSTQDSLAAVAGRSTDDVWAVGDYGSFPGIHTLALHWDGTQWAQAYTPNISPDLATLNGVALDSDGDAWAAGSFSLGGKTLVERFRPGVCCQFAFTDVQPTDYFYEAVRHLYCNGAISGYIDNTFRPYNNTTRGQLAKIVALGFGMPTYTPPTPTFNDVPTTQTFYQYIETAYHLNLVSGYACGGPGEPCPGLYFRPGNLVTRGQLSKIVVVAAGWPLLNPSIATFQDVPVGSTFFPYVETAYDRGIISGYNCGANCLEFRPGNNATRGQIGKIVYNAITQP